MITLLQSNLFIIQNYCLYFACKNISIEKMQMTYKIITSNFP